MRDGDRVAVAVPFDDLAGGGQVLEPRGERPHGRLHLGQVEVHAASGAAAVQQPGGEQGSTEAGASESVMVPNGPMGGRSAQPVRNV